MCRSRHGADRVEPLVDSAAAGGSAQIEHVAVGKRVAGGDHNVFAHPVLDRGPDVEGGLTIGHERGVDLTAADGAKLDRRGDTARLLRPAAVYQRRGCAIHAHGWLCERGLGEVHVEQDVVPREITAEQADSLVDRVEPNECGHCIGRLVGLKDGTAE